MTGLDQSTLGLGLSKAGGEGLNRSAWPALLDLPAGRGASTPVFVPALVPALVLALGDRVAREVGMRAKVEIACVSGYRSWLLT